MKKCVVVFDPYVSINILKESLPDNVYLIGCITPNNNLEFTLKARVNNSDFFKLILLSGEFEQDYQDVRMLENKFEILAYLVGSELFNFRYIDELISKLNGVTNPISSLCRYSKFAMQQALEAFNLNVIKSAIINRQNIVDIKNKIDLFRYPLIVRPNQDSVAALGVKICNNFEEVIDGCNNILEETNNISGKQHENILIQEFLDGDEFNVDTISIKGKHYVSGVFLCKKEIFEDVSIPRYRTNVTNELLIANLSYYANDVLNALGVYTGFGHIEIIYYNNRFFLIELNPRLSGAYGTINVFSSAVYGVNQPQMFFTLLGYQYNNIQRYKYGRLIYLQNFGYTYQGINEYIFKDIPSYYYHKTLITCSDESYNTAPRNLKDTVAIVLLVSNDLEEIEHNYQQIKVAEENGEIYKEINK